MDDQLTYEALITPIPSRFNLANVRHLEPTKTCLLCALLVPDRRKAQHGIIQTGYERVDLYPDFPGLKASAKAGCDFCRVIRKSIRKNWAVRPMEEWGVGPIKESDGWWDELLDARWDRKVKIHNVTLGIIESDHNSVMSTASLPKNPPDDGMVTTLSLDFGPATSFVSRETEVQYGEIGQVLSFKVFDSQDLQVENGEVRRRLPATSTLSIPNLEIISRWITDCKSTHSRCRVDKSHWFPTRLLDVGPADGTQLPRLVETEREGIEGPYAALSHMWGDPNQGQAPPVRTLHANYTQMEEGIPWQIMSKNFIDAVITTRRLGIHFIWIDSLCIIQDSPEDWQKEAAMMYKVYKFAEITIVATSATSANDGFLERRLSTIPAVKMGYALDTEAGSGGNMIVCEQDAAGIGNWLQDIEGSPWNKRGWTLQERSVSTRLLHFCKTKFYFECRGCLRSEENEPLERSSGRTFEMWPRAEYERAIDAQERDRKTRKERMDHHHDEDLYKRWTHSVKEYSQRRLTKKTDRLLAIQVLAGEMPTAIDDIYIPYAGMWIGFMQTDLLWQVHGRPRSMQDDYLAPSWSWVSVDAGIKWEAGSVPNKPSNSALSSDSFKLLEVASHVNTPNPSHNFLKVRAYLKPIAFLLECDNDDRWVNGSRFTFPFDLLISTQSLRNEEPEGSISTLTIVERETAIEEGRFIKFAEGCLDLDDKDDLTKSQRSLFYLHVDRTIPSGLILEAVPSNEALLRRVGVANVFVKNGDLFTEPSCAENTQQIEVTII